MSVGVSVAIATTFLWLGMVVAISFMEAPLKFRAPNATIPLCLGIGRVVFRALNSAEAILAVVLAVALVVSSAPAAVVAGFVVAVLMLVTQLVAVRPRLSRRADQVLAGLDAPRSRAHYAYVGLEVVKVTALLGIGILLLSG